MAENRTLRNAAVTQAEERDALRAERNRWKHIAELNKHEWMTRFNKERDALDNQIAALKAELDQATRTGAKYHASTAHNAAVAYEAIKERDVLKARVEELRAFVRQAEFYLRRHPDVRERQIAKDLAERAYALLSGEPK